MDSEPQELQRYRKNRYHIPKRPLAWRTAAVKHIHEMPSFSVSGRTSLARTLANSCKPDASLSMPLLWIILGGFYVTLLRYLRLADAVPHIILQSHSGHALRPIPRRCLFFLLNPPQRLVMRHRREPHYADASSFLITWTW